MNANGPAVEGVNVTRRSHPGSIPVLYAEIYPGGEEGMAQFLQSQVQVISPDLSLSCPPAARRINWVLESLSVKMKLSKWRAKIVTSLLPQPSVLVVSNF